MNCPPMTLSGDAKLCTEKRRAGAGNGLARRHSVRRGAEGNHKVFPRPRLPKLPPEASGLTPLTTCSTKDVWLG
jgi:hypothetical protein